MMKADRKAYFAAYYAAHREGRKEYFAAYHAAHREQINERVMRYQNTPRGHTVTILARIKFAAAKRRGV